FGEIGRESESVLGHDTNLRQVRFAQLLKEPMNLHAVLNETSHGERKVRIARDGLPVPRSRLLIRLRLQRTLGQAFLVLAFQEKIVGSGVLRWRSGERACFGG